MPALDFRILLIIPLALAETFLLWTLWNLIQQSRKKSHAPSRLANSSQKQVAAQVFNFPGSSSATRAEHSSSRDAGHQPR